MKDLKELLVWHIEHTDKVIEQTNKVVERTNKAVERTNKAVEQTNRVVDKLAVEMKAFKDEMRLEMKEFKDKVDEDTRQMKEDTKKMKKKWGDLADKMGTLVEDIVAPGLYNLLEKYFSVKKDDIIDGGIRRIFKDKQTKNRLLEIDAWAETEDKFFIVEVKSKPNTNNIKHFVDKAYKFKSYPNIFRNKKLILLFTGFNITLSHRDTLIDYSTKNGIYFIVFRDWDYLEIVNFDKLSKQENKS
jgi:hypothetical protein